MNIQLERNTKNVLPTVKLGVSRQIVIPKGIHDALGLAPGDYLEVEVYEGNRLLVTPKVLVDKGHTTIEKRLAKAEKDVHLGRMNGPFKTAAGLARHLKTVASA